MKMRLEDIQNTVRCDRSEPTYTDQIKQVEEKPDGKKMSEVHAEVKAHGAKNRWTKWKVVAEQRWRQTTC